MDTVTHTLTGALIARAFDDQRVGQWGTAAGLAMGAFPDSDFVLGLINGEFYIKFHRDFTHSLILIPFYAALFSWIFIKISKRNHFWSFYKICLAVLLSHVLLDLFTSYGTMVFSPFFDGRYAWDLVFIIDLIFSGIVFFPLMASFLWRRRSKWICRSALAGVAFYVLFCFTQHDRALQLARTYAQSLNTEVVRVASLPQPGSPFRWANYVETRETVYQGLIDLLKKDLSEPVSESGSFFERLDGLYDPPHEVHYRSWVKIPASPWVKKALETDGVRFYFWFARFPVVRAVHSTNGIHRVEFMDVRFLLPTIRTPFVYYVEFNSAGDVRSEGFAQDGHR